MCGMNIYDMTPPTRDLYVPIEPTTPLTLQLLERLSADIEAMPEGDALDAAVEAYTVIVRAIAARASFVAFTEGGAP